MIYSDRNGNKTCGTTKQDKLLELIYSSSVGRALIKPFTCPAVSNLGSAVLSSKLSTKLIEPFIKSNNINMNEYEDKTFNSYNDFFTRQIKSESRPINMDKNALITPCDGKATVYKIDKQLNMRIKNSYYNISSLLNNKELAKEFNGGTCVVIRLSVDNYHRYCYIDNAKKQNNVFIGGKLHTVNPIAFDYVPIFKQNSREYCVLDTENFGKVIQMEVGAMMVGRIINYHGVYDVKKGQEKGKFEFGGSTIVLLFKKDTVEIDSDLIDNSSNNIETLVLMGERIGKKK